MAAPNDEGGYAEAVIEAVQDMTRRLDTYTQAGDESRARLKNDVQEMVAATRQDVQKAITSLQLGQVDHKAAHETDRHERVTRQQQIDAALMEIRQQTSAGLAEIRKWLIVGLVGIALVVGFVLGVWLF